MRSRLVLAFGHGSEGSLAHGSGSAISPVSRPHKPVARESPMRCAKATTSGLNWLSPRRSRSGRGRPPPAALRHWPTQAHGRTRDGGHASTMTTTRSPSRNAAARSGTASTPDRSLPATAAGIPRSSRTDQQRRARPAPRHRRGQEYERGTTAAPGQRPSPAWSTHPLVCRPRPTHVATTTGIRPTAAGPNSLTKRSPGSGATGDYKPTTR